MSFPRKTSKTLSCRVKGTRLHGASAFTLLEVALAMAILALLAGALYAIVDASITGTAELEARGNRSRQLSGFLELCRKNLHTVPGNAVFQARIVQLNDKYVQELVFQNARGLFRWGAPDNSYNNTILGVRPKIGGLLDIGILQDDDSEITSYLNGGTAKRSWLTLMSDLRDVQWRFYDSRNQLWSKDWKDAGFKPSFAELTITTEEGTGKYVFWLPAIQMP